MTLDKIAVAYATVQQQPQAQILAAKLGCLVNNSAPAVLLVTSQQLMLQCAPFTPLAADFSWNTVRHKHSAGKKLALVRAVKPHSKMYIIDATAGWGRDAAILASFGARVLMLERELFMGELLADALARRNWLSQHKLNLELQVIDAMQYLNALPMNQLPDVIYLDPMHPARHKNALVKKDLQILQQLLDYDSKALELLHLARTKVTQHVIMKWPIHGPKLAKSTTTIRSKTVRYDIYRPFLK